jgi:uncharacterized protein DUF4190
MSTPQNPGGDAPQDPQNPYGSPPPPPPSTPPSTPPPSTPPSTPPPSDPAAPPADPSAPVTPVPPAPPYGTPAAPAEPAPPPVYGQPAYGQPAYGQPAYGQPGGPGQPPFTQYAAPQPEQAGKGMAIAALVVSFFGCTCIGALVAIPLAIVVLVRGKDGRNHGKGLAIAALIISILSLLAGIGLAVAVNYVGQFKDVNDLKTGQCITAKGLTDDDAESVTEIKTVSCSSKHDGEILTTQKLTADEAASYGDTDLCGPALEAAGKSELVTEDITVTALAAADPSKGDNVACVAYHADGSKLTGKLGS